jgi:hypothetical protein
MGERKRRLVVLLPAGKRGETLLGWLRQLLPAAVLMIAPPSFAMSPPSPEEVLVVDAQEVDSPLSLADAIARAQEHLGAEQDSGSGQG